MIGSWNRVTFRAVGGLTEVGFSADEQFLLVVSWQGRGLIDTRSGEMVARDSEIPQATSTWLRRADRIVIGIGPVNGVPIKSVGLWGGSLPARCGTEVVEMNPSGEEVLLRDESSGMNQILQRTLTEVRAAGFSPSGDILVIATSADVEIFRRAG